MKKSEACNLELAPLFFPDSKSAHEVQKASEAQKHKLEKLFVELHGLCNKVPDGIRCRAGVMAIRDWKKAVVDARKVLDLKQKDESKLMLSIAKLKSYWE